MHEPGDEWGTPSQPRRRKQWALVRWFGAWDNRDWRMLAITFLGTVSGAIATVIIIGAALSVAKYRPPWYLGGSVFLLGIILIIFSLLASWCFEKVKKAKKVEKVKKAFEGLFFSGLP
jgi:hypothetical protein